MQLSEEPGQNTGERKLLESMVERAKQARLTSEEEKEAVRLTGEALVSGKAGIAEAVDAMVQLPWSVAVEALNNAWPEMKPATGRKQFLSAIASHASDQAHRIRLSLARGLFPTDPGAAVKLLVTTCEEMRAPEGKLQAKDRSPFTQVLIGKAKPWLTNVSLADLKPAEAAHLVGATLDVIGGCAPLAQQGLLSWLAASGFLKELSKESTTAITKALARWKPELRKQFQASHPELPEAIATALAAAPEPKQQNGPPPKEEEIATDEKREAQKQERQKRKGKENGGPGPKAKGQRPENGFDLNNALRQIDAHVKELQAELSQTKNALRQRETRTKGSTRNPAEEIDVEELKRHNVQLEETVQALRQQLEDLANHHEDVALSQSAHEDPTEQFKELLKIKLQKDHDDFKTLAKEPPDEVFREHYRILLDNVFNTLAQQGVRLE